MPKNDSQSNKDKKNSEKDFDQSYKKSDNSTMIKDISYSSDSLDNSHKKTWTVLESDGGNNKRVSDEIIFEEAHDIIEGEDDDTENSDQEAWTVLEDIQHKI